VSQPALHLILASKSPRRRELLARAGYAFTVCPADEHVESEVCGAGEAAELVRELAYRKAADVVPRIRSGQVAPAASTRPACVVLGCDTVVECDGRILGKPLDRGDARRILENLRGRRHRVLSGLCLWPIDGDEASVEVAVTTLYMDPLSDDQLDDYLAGDEWRGKAGGFGYQDRTGWVRVIDGSESNVVGLPLELLEAMLSRLGYASPSAKQPG
jgi:septum formation protein